MKNYYKILGVIEDAEDIVIRAAYRALAQKYHPDKRSGVDEAADARMIEINEAYAVLSNAETRKSYDQELFRNRDPRDAENFGNEYDEKDVELDEAWKMACGFFPGLNKSYSELKKLSPRLANTYRVDITENKKFNQHEVVQKSYTESYLSKFYGDDRKIKQLAKELLMNGFASDAIRLNKIIRLMGSSVSFQQVVTGLMNENKNLSIVTYAGELIKVSDRARIDEKYKASIRKKLKNLELTREQVKNVGEEFLGLRIEIKDGFISNWFIFEANGVKHKLDDLEMAGYLLKNI